MNGTAFDDATLQCFNGCFGIRAEESSSYVPLVGWADFAPRFLLWPSIIQLVIVILLRVLSPIYEKRRWREIPWITQHLGCADSPPKRIGFYVTLMSIQLLFSLSASFMWVSRTYTQEISTIDRNIEICFAIFFAFAYVIHLLTRELLPSLAISPAPLIDVFTIAPCLLPGDGIWLSLLFCRVYRALDAFVEIERVGGLAHHQISEFTRAIMYLVLKGLCLVINLGGIIFTLEVLGEIPGLEDQFIETDMGSLSFVQMVYWIFTTISTVGYGDFSPTTVPSRLFAIVAIVVGVVFFSVETGNLVMIKNLLDTGNGSYLVRPNVKHVVVTGGGVKRGGPVVYSFLSELFSNDEELHWPDCVLMWNGPMDAALKSYIKDSMSTKIQSHIEYFVGTPMSSADLERVQLEQAHMVFVLADAAASDQDKEDGQNLLRALSVMKEYPNTKLRLMLLRPESKGRATNAGIATERCFSANEIKSNLLAHCCRCRGYLTLLSNMMDSGNVEMDESERWKMEYLNGSNSAIYGMLVSSKYKGKTWAEFTRALFQETGAVAFAAQVEGRVILNPAGLSKLPLHGGEVAFVITYAQDDVSEASEKQDWQPVFRTARAEAQRKKSAAPVKVIQHVENATTSAITVQTAAMKFKGKHDDASSLAMENGAINRGQKSSEKLHDAVRALKLPDPQSPRLATPRQASPKKGASGKDNPDLLQEHQRARARILASAGGHIALLSCSQERAPWQQIKAFLQPLRSPARAWEHRPIIVLTVETPLSELVESHADVAFVKGSALKPSDLEWLRLEAAKEVVLLAGDRPSIEDAHLQDYNLVVVANTLDMLLRDKDHEAFSMYELHHSPSTKFLPDLSKVASVENGSSSTSKLQRSETMNPRLSRLSLSASQIFAEKPQKLPWALRADMRFASGGVFSLHFLGQMLGREYYVPSTMELLEALVMPARKGQPSFPWLVPVPEEMNGRTFLELLVTWTSGDDCAIPLGLYRQLFPDSDHPSARSLGYVVARPPADFKVYSTDQVYVLAPPGWGKRVLGSALDLSADGNEPAWRVEFAGLNESGRLKLDRSLGATSSGEGLQYDDELPNWAYPQGNSSGSCSPFCCAGSSSTSNGFPAPPDQGESLRVMKRLDAMEASLQALQKGMSDLFAHLGKPSPRAATSANGSQLPERGCWPGGHRQL